MIDMAQQTSNTPEKNSGDVQEKSIAELLATGEYDYLGGGLIVKRKEKKDGRV